MEHENVHVKWAHGPRPKQKLLDRAQAIIRLKHYSIRTERAYLNWMRRYILFHHKRHPKEMGPAELEAFLTHLAMAGNVARSRGTCPLLLSLAGGGLVSARQPARAAPAACVVRPIPAGTRQPSACVSPP